MFSYSLKTSVMALLVAASFGATACGSHDDDTYDPARDESFMTLMGTADGKADGLRVEEGSADAEAVLHVVNAYDFARLEADVGLDRRLVANLLADRPYDTLRELDDTPWTTMAAFTRIWNHAHTHGLAATSFCQQDRCYDVTTIELDLDGELTFDVAADGAWWVRAHLYGSTIREARGRDRIDEVATSTFSGDELDAWVARRADGSLTALTRVGSSLHPEHGAPLELGELQVPVAAAYDVHDDLYVAAAAYDASGLVQGLVILRQTDDGWFEELKKPFATTAGAALNAQFVVTTDDLSLWVDTDHAARKYSRATSGWRESMVLDMQEAGFGAHPDDRTVKFHAHDGVVFVHRATWNFSRRQDVVRIDGNMVTAIIDLPTTARTIAPHADETFSIVHADGTIAHMRDDEQKSALGPASPDDLVRTNGDDIYVLQDRTLRILRAR